MDLPLAELPDSVGAIGARLAAGGVVTAPPELFADRTVFDAEVARLFVRPWLAVDHASRLPATNGYFRFDVGTRSVIVTRDAAGELHALRNVCLHAGYRVCEEEDGHGDTLWCRYHDWEYALDGLLTEPLLRPEQPDRSRYRLPRYAVRVESGLILVDLSTAAPTAPAGAPLAFGALPEALAHGTVIRRRRYPTSWNWKPLRRLLWSSPDLAFAGEAAPQDDADTVAVGPLSLVVLCRHRAALLRLIPRYPGNSEIEIVEIALPGAPASEPNDAQPDRLAEALRRAGDVLAVDPAAGLDDRFFAWYWALMSTPPL